MSWSSCCTLLLLLSSAALAAPDNAIFQVPDPSARLDATAQNLLSSLHQRYPQMLQGKLSLREIFPVLALLSLLPSLWYFQRRRNDTSLMASRYLDQAKCGAVDSPTFDINESEAEALDPSLLKKHSEFKSYSTSRFTYPSLRTFFRRHPQADKLPTTPAALPLLVFIHGLGGSVAQFNPLLASLVNLASCLAIDLPGCGLSKFSEKSWDAYTVEALAELVGTVIEDYREKDTRQGVVLIGHSMGCSLAALLASKTSPHSPALSENIVGLVAVCPRAEPPAEDEVSTIRKLLWVPNSLFDLWRRWDRCGGIESASVHRFVGKDADEETKRMQLRFNDQSRSGVWRRMAAGTLPTYERGIARGGLPGADIWAGLEVPVFLVAGEADNITTPLELTKIASFLGKSYPVRNSESSEPIVDSAAPVVTSLKSSTSASLHEQIDSLEAEDFIEVESTATETSSHEDPSTPNEEQSHIPPHHSGARMVLKTTILPAPASHSLLYTPSTVRILAGLISDFLCAEVSPRLSLGWQLQFLSTSGKWDVKNLAKWTAVTPVSEPIAGIFRAMKTLREVDDSHCPEKFVRDWGDQIKDIVDISHESPVYDPRGLEKGGVRYHKLPTVSKIPPTSQEVAEFIALVDRLLGEQQTRAEEEHWETNETYVGVHCHYGFNRTGYFIVCYLVERRGFGVQAAIDEFARRRPRGIKHAHFLDQIFVRYCKGLRKIEGE